MTYKTWNKLYDAFRRHHNMLVERLKFVEPEKAVSVDSI